MSWYQFADSKAATNGSYKKASPLLLSLALFTVGLGGCRNPSAKNLSDTFVSTCVVTPALLKANTCLNFVKSPQSQCFLRLHGYTAPDHILKAAEAELGDFATKPSVYQSYVQKKDVGIAPQERQSLSYYTGQGYRSMNKALRGDDELFSTHQNRIYAAASGLNKLKKFEGEVYRKENVNSSLLNSIQEAFKVGNIVIEKTFLSTTSLADFNFVYPRGGLYISYKIQSKTGRDLKYVAANEFEAEVIFLPGSAFRVLSFNQEMIKVRPQPLDSPDTVYTTALKIEMEEVDLVD